MMVPGLAIIPLLVSSKPSHFSEQDIHCNLLQAEVDRRVGASQIRLAWVGVVVRAGFARYPQAPSSCIIS